MSSVESALVMDEEKLLRAIEMTLLREPKKSLASSFAIFSLASTSAPWKNSHVSSLASFPLLLLTALPDLHFKTVFTMSGIMSLCHGTVFSNAWHRVARFSGLDSLNLLWEYSISMISLDEEMEFGVELGFDDGRSCCLGSLYSGIKIFKVGSMLFLVSEDKKWCSISE